MNHAEQQHLADPLVARATAKLQEWMVEARANADYYRRHGRSLGYLVGIEHGRALGYLRLAAYIGVDPALLDEMQREIEKLFEEFNRSGHE